ncbi:MAG: ferrous iron transport protein B [Bacteroidales bacterium]|nr:ferrous iron transport protein B [Bacteroidales bacterium]
MQLSELRTGTEGVICKIRGRGAFRRRIMEMGFVKGKTVRVIKNAPLKDPIEYELLGYRVSLRKSEAELIEVRQDVMTEETKVKDIFFRNERSERILAPLLGNSINVAFVGNPNAGKTSIFNFTSRSNEHTGNYSGVTIDSKTAVLKKFGHTYHITDLPGTYSLSAYSPEELFVREYITDKIPDVVVNVVDASNLERNLYLTTQLIDMDIRVVLAFNMYDELEKRDDLLDREMLSKLLGIPIVPTVGSKGKGIDDLLKKIAGVFNDTDSYTRHIHINYGQEIEASIARIQDLIKVPENFKITDRVSSRFIAIKLLEKDRHVAQYIDSAPNHDEILALAEKERKRVENLIGEDMASLLTEKRYGFISGALHETFERNKQYEVRTSEILDSLLTHKLFGFPFFIFFMWLMFTATFKLGAYPQGWIESGVLELNKLLHDIMPEGSLRDLLTEGIIGGVGGVIVFLPNILILFLFISFMEDSGYMARAVFIMDKLMHKIGLHGKSFIPLIMGFGCNVPAIMATRTIEDRNNRILTILINPFMSCSARLPVYLLLIGAIFPAYQGTILFGLYFLGILIAIGVAILFKKLVFKTEGTPFVMELPPYRLPTLRSSTKHMWGKGSQYLKKMGGVILLASILLWALGYFPRPKDEPAGEETTEIMLTVSTNPDASNRSQNVQLDQEADPGIEQLENSYIARIGKFIEPAIRPLGFDWKMGVSLLAGIAAKEVVVSTLGVMYHEDVEEDGEELYLAQKLRSEKYVKGPYQGELVFNPLATLSFLVFVLIYFPCIAVFAAVRKETGNIGWAFLMIGYTTVLAYLVSLMIFQTGKLFTILL